METHRLLKKVALAAVFTAVSIVIDIFFKQLLGLPNFGVPFYAIPLVYGSILLGPAYGVIMSVISDAVGVMLSPYGYLPLFVIAPVFWGLLPGIIMGKKKKNWMRLAIAIFATYLFASLANTLAIFYYYGEGSALATLLSRVGLIPFNTIIMFFIIKELIKKLEPISERFFDQPLKADESEI